MIKFEHTQSPVPKSPETTLPSWSANDFSTPSNKENYYQEQQDFANHPQSQAKQETYEEQVANVAEDIFGEGKAFDKDREKWSAFEKAKEQWARFAQWDAEIENTNQEIYTLNLEVKKLEEITGTKKDANPANTKPGKNRQKNNPEKKDKEIKRKTIEESDIKFLQAEIAKREKELAKPLKSKSEKRRIRREIDKKESSLFNPLITKEKKASLQTEIAALEKELNEQGKSAADIIELSNEINKREAELYNPEKTKDERELIQKEIREKNDDLKNPDKSDKEKARIQGEIYEILEILRNPKDVEKVKSSYQELIASREKELKDPTKTKEEKERVQKEIGALQNLIRNECAPREELYAKWLTSEIKNKKLEIIDATKEKAKLEKEKKDNAVEQYAQDFRNFLTKKYGHILNSHTMQKMLTSDMGKLVDQSKLQELLMQKGYDPTKATATEVFIASNGNIQLSPATGKYYEVDTWTIDDSARYLALAQSRLASDFISNNESSTLADLGERLNINKKGKENKIGELPSLSIDPQVRFRIGKEIMDNYGDKAAIDYLNLSQFIVKEVKTAQNSKAQNNFDKQFNKKVKLGFWGRIGVAIEAWETFKSRISLRGLLHHADLMEGEDEEGNFAIRIRRVEGLEPDASLAQIIKDNYTNITLDDKQYESIAHKVAGDHPELFYDGLSSNNTAQVKVRVGHEKAPMYLNDTINQYIKDFYQEKRREPTYIERSRK